MRSFVRGLAQGPDWARAVLRGAIFAMEKISEF